MSAGCDDTPELVQTELSIVLPDRDEAARATLETLEIEVWRADDGACSALTAWRTSVCGSECTPAPRPDGRSPLATGTLVRADGGGWTSMPMPLTGEAWEVVVTGLDVSGAAVLYGCRSVASARDGAIRLWRPWCDVEVCAGQLHPACAVAVDCRAPALEDPDGLGAPRCVALAETAASWEESGRACPQSDDVLPYAPCRSAIVRCEPGSTEIVRDGICPRAEGGATTCGASAADDLDCDGVLPGPCGSCVAGTIERCGDPSGESCAGSSTCGPDGRFGDCVLEEPAPEVCNGIDDDCDDLGDALDPDAVTGCNRDRATRSPRADGCADDGRCLCGRVDACVEGEMCCGGSCVAVTSIEHCGFCNHACARGDTCRGGLCIPPGIDAGPQDSGPIDAGPADAGTRDMGPMDAGTRDTGPPDTGPIRDAARTDREA